MTERISDTRKGVFGSRSEQPQTTPAAENRLPQAKLSFLSKFSAEELKVVGPKGIPTIVKDEIQDNTAAAIPHANFDADAYRVQDKTAAAPPVSFDADSYREQLDKHIDEMSPEDLEKFADVFSELHVSKDPNSIDPRQTRDRRNLQVVDPYAYDPYDVDPYAAGVGVAGVDPYAAGIGVAGVGVAGVGVAGVGVAGGGVAAAGIGVADYSTFSAFNLGLPADLRYYGGCYQRRVINVWGCLPPAALARYFIIPRGVIFYRGHWCRRTVRGFIIIRTRRGCWRPPFRVLGASTLPYAAPFAPTGPYGGVYGYGNGAYRGYGILSEEDAENVNAD